MDTGYIASKFQNQWYKHLFLKFCNSHKIFQTVIVRLRLLHREAAAHAVLTPRPLGVQTREATAAAALSLCPRHPSSPSLTKAVRRVPAPLMTCLLIPEIKVQEVGTAYLLFDLHSVPFLWGHTCWRNEGEHEVRTTGAQCSFATGLRWCFS